jgi:hypothetical protein
MEIDGRRAGSHRAGPMPVNGYNNNSDDSLMQLIESIKLLTNSSIDISKAVSNLENSNIIDILEQIGLLYSEKSKDIILSLMSKGISNIDESELARKKKRNLKKKE